VNWIEEDREFLGDITGSEIANLIPDERERRVQFFLEQERAKREARRRLNAEGHDAAPPAIDTLRARLAIPREFIPPRIQNWQPQQSRVMLAAQFKAGKTTLVGNVIRSLVDGDLFLGRDDVTPIEGTVVDIDCEMGESQALDWLSAQGIRQDDRVVPVFLRGRVASFNILDDTIRAAWAQRIRDAGGTYVILDPIRPILDALGLDEHTEAGRFLVAFDALLKEAGRPGSADRPPHGPQRRTLARRFQIARLARCRVAPHSKRRGTVITPLHHSLRARRRRPRVSA
jgi:hypothetical protein